MGQMIRRRERCGQWRICRTALAQIIGYWSWGGFWKGLVGNSCRIGFGNGGGESDRY